MATSATTFLRGAALPLAAIALWEILSNAGVLPMDSTSRPSLIVQAGWEGFADGSIPLATWQTLEAGGAGVLIAVTAGVLGGMILGLSARLQGLSDRPWKPSVRCRPSPSFRCRFSCSALAFAWRRRWWRSPASGRSSW
jgi:ABC-type nitrate/sulfonate/bicarbonate transport system permease component